MVDGTTTVSRAEGTYRAERHIECEAHIENTEGIYIDSRYVYLTINSIYYYVIRYINLKIYSIYFAEAK